MGSGSSSLYRGEDGPYEPSCYPKVVESVLSDLDLKEHHKLLDHCDDALSARFESLTLEDYQKHFAKQPDKFDW